MKRILQPPGKRGSLHWIQHFVNNDPDALNSAIGLGQIKWVSPRKEDDYSEYRDEAALERLDVKLTRRPLSSFKYHSRYPKRFPSVQPEGRGSVSAIQAAGQLEIPGAIMRRGWPAH
jgi:hypothetical protein